MQKYGMVLTPYDNSLIIFKRIGFSKKSKSIRFFVGGKSIKLK